MESSNLKKKDFRIRANGSLKRFVHSTHVLHQVLLCRNQVSSASLDISNSIMKTGYDHANIKLTIVRELPDWLNGRNTHCLFIENKILPRGREQTRTWPSPKAQTPGKSQRQKSQNAEAQKTAFVKIQHKLFGGIGNVKKNAREKGSPAQNMPLA